MDVKKLACVYALSSCCREQLLTTHINTGQLQAVSPYLGYPSDRVQVSSLGKCDVFLRCDYKNYEPS